MFLKCNRIFYEYFLNSTVLPNPRNSYVGTEYNSSSLSIEHPIKFTVYLVFIFINYEQDFSLNRRVVSEESTSSTSHRLDLKTKGGCKFKCPWLSRVVGIESNSQSSAVLLVCSCLQFSWTFLHLVKYKTFQSISPILCCFMNNFSFDDFYWEVY